MTTGLFRLKLVLSGILILAIVALQTNISHADLSELAKLVAADGKYADFFGSSVSISGEYAIVGAPSADTGAVNAGAAYIFERSDGTWNEVDHLVGPPMFSGAAGAHGLRSKS
jgi:hypothetical protein